MSHFFDFRFKIAEKCRKKFTFRPEFSVTRGKFYEKLKKSTSNVIGTETPTKEPFTTSAAAAAAAADTLAFSYIKNRDKKPKIDARPNGEPIARSISCSCKFAVKMNGIIKTVQAFNFIVMSEISYA